MKINFDVFLHIGSWISILWGIIPILLYCEIHYRLRWFRGFLYRSNPEIIFDLPVRITGKTLPVLLLIKDSNHFPIHVDKAEIQIFHNNKKVLKKEFRLDKSLSQLFWSEIFTIDVSEFVNQKLTVKCFLYKKDANKTIVVENHNLSKKFHHDFTVFVDDEPVACPTDWRCGDLHVHSNYTEDQVEFGAPLTAYQRMGKALGLNFAAIVDHAYDFDDTPGTWTFQDNNFTKWKNFKEEVRKLNETEKDFTLLPGYEISVDNGLGENVHMAVINNDEIFSGTGDAMENLKSYPSEHFFYNLLDKLNKKAFAFAAHPKTPQPFLHRKILKRGQWHSDNFVNKLTGFQILNGCKGEEFYAGKKLWIEKLLSGKRQYIFAGTDAHGNFNFNLSIKYPLLSMKENKHHIFGEFFSYVKTGSETNVTTLVQGLKTGKIVVSEGPFLSLTISKEDKDFGIGDEIKFLPEKIIISAASNSFFGNIDTIRLIVGNCSEKVEQALELHDINQLHYNRDLGIILKPEDCYIRAELFTDKEKIALTNPIWISCKQ